MQYRILSWLFFYVSIVVSTSVLASDSNLVDSKVSFAQYEISTPFKVSLPVIVADVIATEQFPSDELVVIGEDENSQTWLAVYVFHQKTAQFVLFDKMMLSDEFFAFDVSENEQGIYFLAQDKVVGLRYHDDLNDKSGIYLQDIQKVNSIFLIENSTFLIEKDFIMDVNKDDRDDIVLADFQQTNVWISSKDSTELAFQPMAIMTQTELDRGGVSFKPTRLTLADFTVDGLQDIAWVSTGKINYFKQLENGKYSTQQESLKISDKIHGLNWWQIRGADGKSPDQSNLVHRMVEAIQDVNGDGLADVVVRFTQSSGVLDRTNNYEFYLGFLNKNSQLEFPVTPNTTIEAEGTSTGLKIIDVNGDDKFEVLLSSFELSVGNIIGALLAGGIDQNVLVFSLEDNDIYEEDPTISKEVELSFSLTSGRSGQPIVLVTDVNGDDLKDLILSADEDEVDIFLGQTGSRLFNRKASKHELKLPKNGALFEHHDINKDGKQDFIMRYGRLDDESMANKITILMVK